MAQGWVRSGERALAPSCCAPQVHDQSREIFQCNMWHRPNFANYRLGDFQFEIARLDKTSDLRSDVLKEDVRFEIGQ